MTNDDLMMLAEGLSQQAETEAQYVPTTGGALNTFLEDAFTAGEDIGMQLLNIGPAELREGYGLRDKLQDTGQIINQFFNTTRFGDGSRYESPYEDATTIERIVGGVPDPGDAARVAARVAPEVLNAAFAALPQRFADLMRYVSGKDFLTNAVYHGTRKSRRTPNAPTFSGRPTQPFDPGDFETQFDQWYGPGMYHSASLNDAASYATLRQRQLDSEDVSPVIRKDFLLGDYRIGSEVVTRDEVQAIVETFVRNNVGEIGTDVPRSEVDSLVKAIMYRSSTRGREVSRSGKVARAVRNSAPASDIATPVAGPRIENVTPGGTDTNYPILEPIDDPNLTSLQDVMTAMGQYAHNMSKYAKTDLADQLRQQLDADYVIITNAYNPSGPEFKTTEIVTFNPADTVISADSPSEWARWFRRNAPRGTLTRDDRRALGELAQQFEGAQVGNLTPERARAAVRGYPRVNEFGTNIVEDDLDMATFLIDELAGRQSRGDPSMSIDVDDLIENYYGDDLVR